MSQSFKTLGLVRERERERAREVIKNKETIVVSLCDRRMRKKEIENDGNHDHCTRGYRKIHNIKSLKSLRRYLRGKHEIASFPHTKKKTI